jgi:serine/threonine protein kinase
VDGTPFGRYRLVELLGRGGMGEVWRAYDTVTDRIVAVKVLPAHFGDNPEFQERFRREAHAASRLNTPHVIPIHTYGEIDGRLYVDMRLIEGRDLQTVLADGPLEPARAVRIIDGVAKALYAAHKVGLVHRDVKPSNILLDDDDFPYLIDFGIARAAAETRLTSTGDTIGTFQYMAPERLGTGQEDARADIYALACVLYECLTGSPPFAGDSVERLVVAHLNTPPPQPSTGRPTVPAQFDKVIAGGMAKDPDQRYATTVELANAARDAITVPIQTPATSGETRTQVIPAPSMNNAPTRYAGNSAASDPTLLAHTAPPAERPPSQPLNRRTKIMLGVGALVVVAIVVVAVVLVVVLGNKSSPAGSVASPTKTSTTSRTTQAAPNLAGTWKGRSSIGEDVELTINSPNKLDGSITYKTASHVCVGSWTETGRHGKTTQVQERVRSGANCEDENWDVTVTGSHLAANATWRSSGGSAQTLTLTKTR